MLSPELLDQINALGNGKAKRLLENGLGSHARNVGRSEKLRKF